MHKIGVIYIRKSYVPPGRTDPASPAMQEQVCRNACIALGLQPEVYTDAEGHLSGKTDDRPAWQRARARLADSNVQALIVYAWNRAFRNTRLLLGLVDDLDQLGKRFVSVSHNLDTSTADGRMILTFLAAVDESEVTRSSERRVATIDYLRREKGRHYGTAPFGTVRLRSNGDLVLSPSQLEQALGTDHQALTELYRLNALGRLTYAQIADQLNTAGWLYRRRSGELVAWRPERVRSVLSEHWLYSGHVVVGRAYRGDCEILPGSHGELLPHQLTQAAAVRFAGRLPLRHRQPPAAYPLSGVLRCACGDWLPGARDKYSGRQYAHSRPCKLGLKRTAPADEAEARVIERIAGLAIPPDVIQQTRENAMQILSVEQGGRSAEAERQRIDAALARLKDLYTWGDLTADEYQRKKAELQAELPAAGPQTPAAAALTLAVNVHRASPGVLQTLVRSLYQEITVVDRDRTLVFVTKEWCREWG
jgi:DNA invertase Pin-like site-specific DNA recombinase